MLRQDSLYCSTYNKKQPSEMLRRVDWYIPKHVSEAAWSLDMPVTATSRRGITAKWHESSS
jgi:hypothetical protein